MESSKKLSKLLFTLALAIFTLGPSALANGAPQSGDGLGLNRVFGQSGILSGGRIDLQSGIVLAFQLFLAALIGYVVYLIGAAAFQLGRAREDSEKKKDAFKSLFSAGLMLAVGVSALGLTNVVASFVGGDPKEVVGVPCTSRDEGSNNITRIGRVNSEGLCVYTNEAGEDEELTPLEQV